MRGKRKKGRRDILSVCEEKREEGDEFVLVSCHCFTFFSKEDDFLLKQHGFVDLKRFVLEVIEEMFEVETLVEQVLLGLKG